MPTLSCGITLFERDDMVVREIISRGWKSPSSPSQIQTRLEIWSELARRVGLGEYFLYTPQDYMKMLLDSGHLSYLDHLRTPGKRKDRERHVPSFLRSLCSTRNLNALRKNRIYNECLVEFNQELPVHQETLESPRRSPLAERYH